MRDVAVVGADHLITGPTGKVREFLMRQRSLAQAAANRARQLSMTVRKCSYLDPRAETPLPQAPTRVPTREGIRLPDDEKAAAVSG